MIAMLAEEILLLALDSGKGRVPCTASAALPFGLAGAILAELLQCESLQIDQSDRVFVKDGSPVGDEILDAALVQLHQPGEGRGFRYWLSALLYGMDDLESRLLGRLVKKGILRKEENRFLGMFPLSTCGHRERRGRPGRSLHPWLECQAESRGCRCHAQKSPYAKVPFDRRVNIAEAGS